MRSAPLLLSLALIFGAGAATASDAEQTGPSASAATQRFSEVQNAVASGTASQSTCDGAETSAGAPSSALWQAWSFDCAHPRYQDKALQAKIEALYADIIDTGVERIHDINPALAGILTHRFRQLHKLSITCTYALDDFSGIEADASMDSKLTPQGYDATMNLHEYYVLQVLKKAIEAGKPVPQELKGVLFHELLHAVHLDNEPVAVHDQGPIPNPRPGAVTQDLIYACTAQAYAAQRATEISSSGQEIYDGPQVCETCAEGRERASPTATGEEFTLATDPDSRAEASRRCRSVRVQYAPKSSVSPEE